MMFVLLETRVLYTVFPLQLRVSIPPLNMVIFVFTPAVHVSVTRCGAARKGELQSDGLSPTSDDDVEE